MSVQSISTALHQPHKLILDLFQTENMQEVIEFTLPFKKVEKKSSQDEQCC